MLKQLKKWFSKGTDDLHTTLPLNEHARFIITVDHLTIGILESMNGEWIFKYTEEFKEHKDKDKYKLIVGFPDVDKEYRSQSLWPFFRIRIPGLKQPSVQRIIKEEHIDQDNEVALLKRFGHRTISNPYELVPE